MRSQITAEFIVLISLGILIFTVVIVVVGDQVKELYDGRAYIITRNKALEIQSELYIAAQVHHGYERNFTIDPEPEGIPIDVTLNIDRVNKIGTLVLKGSKYEHVLRVPVNINGDIQLGKNYINNTRGEIYLNP